jgi:hypothetical protein
MSVLVAFWVTPLGVVVKGAVDAVAARAPRVSTAIKADYRSGASGALTAKVQSVERHLGAGSGGETGAGAGAGVAPS